MVQDTHQSDPLSPRAFIAFLGGMKEVKGKVVTVHGKRVWNQSFADDIDLIDKVIWAFSR